VKQRQSKSFLLLFFKKEGLTFFERKVRMNIAAANIELTAADLLEIETASSNITVQGARYPERLEALTGR
jgi:hypothetical protein